MTNLEICTKVCPKCYKIIAPVLDERIESKQHMNAVYDERNKLLAGFALLAYNSCIDTYIMQHEGEDK